MVLTSSLVVVSTMKKLTRARAEDDEDGGVIHDYDDTFVSFRRGGKERAAPPLPLDDTERRAAAEESPRTRWTLRSGDRRHESPPD
ncbi:MAG: hypothetical protein R2688_09170 [Fimbriimonadaceae bacterium]